MARAYRPFRFTDLERLSREQLAVLRTLHAYLPGSAFTPGFKQGLAKTLQTYVRGEVDIWLDSMKPASSSELLSQLPSPTLVAVIGLPPSNHKILMELDLPLAALAVERVLGGQGAPGDGQSALTEIEQGVFAFLVLKVLEQLQGGLGDEASVALRFEGLYSTREGLTDSVDLAQEYFCLGFKLFFDLHVGFAKVCLPSRLIRSKLRPPPPDDSAAAQRRRDGMRARLNWLDNVRGEFAVEAGRAELMPQDIEQLDVGDIILLEETALEMANDALSGTVQLRLGDGTHGYVTASIEDDAQGHVSLQVEGIVHTVQPAAEELEDDDEELEEDEDEEADEE